MKKDKTNIVNTPFSSKAKILQAEDREYIDLDFYVWDADPNNLSVTDYQRVFRGGSWYRYLRNLRSAKRNGTAPTHHDINLGFRLVLQKKNEKKIGIRL